MRLHILGIAGTFMTGIALLARQLGWSVTGSDRRIYPPMSEVLATANIEVQSGYSADYLSSQPDLVLVGNVLSRGNPAIEALLDSGIPYQSGPQWLAEQVLQHRWVIAVAGTHGKTTTTSMLVHVLSHAGLSPGYLIGGVPNEAMAPASLGDSDFFVVEADEYDAAFFDKRAKFMHYRPRTLVINNIEYDHADIYPDLATIRRQFHHLIRTVPSGGCIFTNGDDAEVARTLELGCWTPVEFMGGASNRWRVTEVTADGGQFTIQAPQGEQYNLHWSLFGLHNVSNACMALAAARHVGVPLAEGIAALRAFGGVRRRLELIWQGCGMRIYDDFAHHPTAIAASLGALRAQQPKRLRVALEVGSNTMRMGVHSVALVDSLAAADEVCFYSANSLAWNLCETADQLVCDAQVCDSIDRVVEQLLDTARSGDTIVMLSNGAFDGLRDRILASLTAT